VFLRAAVAGGAGGGVELRAKSAAVILEEPSCECLVAPTTLVPETFRDMGAETGGMFISLGSGVPVPLFPGIGLTVEVDQTNDVAGRT
jgi:hypothetical protein